MIAILFLLTAATVQSEKKVINDFVLEKHVLGNGLKVIIGVSNKVPLVSYYTSFNVGSYDEEVGKTGLAHLFEHLMFMEKGDKRYVVEGGSSNAFTTNDETRYVSDFEKSFLPRVIEQEAYRMTSLNFDPEVVQTEINIVLEELRMRYQDAGVGKLFIEAIAKVFKDSSYEPPVGGYEQDVSSLTVSDLVNFYRTFYAPNNAVIAVVGDVNPEEVLEMITNAYGNIPRNYDVDVRNLLKKKKMVEFKKEVKEIYKVKGDFETPRFIMIFPVDITNRHSLEAKSILSSILSATSGSYIDQLYVHSADPWLISVGIGSYYLRRAGLLYIDGQLANGKDLEDFSKQFTSDMNTFCSDEVLSEYNFIKATNKNTRANYEYFSSRSNVASTILVGENLYGDYWEAFRDISKEVSLEDVKKECVQLFQEGNYQLFSIWNKY